MVRELKETTYQMLLLEVDPFIVIMRKLARGFYDRVFSSDNDIVKCILGCDTFYMTPLYRRWQSLPY